MDDSFEDFIRYNRDKFDHLDPDPGLWNQVRKHTGFKKRISWRLILQRAAMVIVIFSASYGVNELVHRYHNNHGRTGKSQTAKGTSVPGLREAEAYYTGLVNQKLDELKPIMANCPSLNEELNLDMSELDSVYIDLKNDLKDNIANQEVVEAIIENYRLKISILENLLTEIKPRKGECLTKPAGHAL